MNESQIEVEYWFSYVYIEKRIDNIINVVSQRYFLQCLYNIQMKTYSKNYKLSYYFVATCQCAAALLTILFVFFQSLINNNNKWSNKFMEVL